ncbi:MAG: hypothetical protein ACKODN_10580 [Actinomycetota bacterium]
MHRLADATNLIHHLGVDGEATRGGDDQVKRTEAIIRSMTPEERENPSVINGSRRTRIAKGSGTQVQDVNRLVKQFGEMQKMMKQFGGRLPSR